MTSRRTEGRLIAVLGPTNTGKTYLAIERMLGHKSGMIGFPLRLLARENYDRIVALHGAGSVALLTGEEKILPAHPRWFICTVESMPVERTVDFLAIDEIQLAADPERGHIFTDRLLHARGLSETMVLGAETIKPLLRQLVPDAEFISRPRFSQLSWTGPRKLTRLPARSAIVAFSAAEVYTLAEMIRGQRGGAAVVLGALSPRTRNAQVGLYQAGEVDYLVATDAIGMGLNMNIDHVAFAAQRKFDGRAPRDLSASEVAQIAGRAGRHMKDGSFGTTGDVAGFDAAVIDAVENHSFPPLKRLQWRNDRLVFTSPAALLTSLNRPATHPGLIRAREADDQLVLQALLRDAQVLSQAKSPERVRLLWDCCQIPDFRKSLAEQHSRLVAAIFGHLSSQQGVLPADWLDRQLSRLERIDGDIDTLMSRIANVRTWTYVSHHADWLTDPGHWQERSRALEDRLSDALHHQLTQRFVDRRTAVLTKRLKDSNTLLSSVNAEGEVRVEGQFVGHLDGFRFRADPAEGLKAVRTISAAAQRALKQEINGRIGQVAAAADEAFALTPQGFIRWQDAEIARLTRGPEAIRPGLILLQSDLLELTARDRLQARLDKWLAGFLANQLAPLYATRDAPLTGAARGLTYQLSQALGSMPRRPAQAQVAALTESDRKSLARLGVRLGVESIFLPALLKPGSQRLRGLLWFIHQDLPPWDIASGGAVSRRINTDRPAACYEAVGYRCLGPRAIRVDMLERFAAQIRPLAKQGNFQLTPALASLIGASMDEAGLILQALGYQRFGTDAEANYRPLDRQKRRNGGGKRPNRDSPFAALERMDHGR
ncbi:MAG TPA: DEAD/DEAH box helicase [Rhodospirillaceae bacterium]|nr:DEAD/DEAH box helicase [Rhodospirillaceae bacterium]